jgi:hypothetical protein
MAKLSAAELAKREDVIQKMKKNKRSLVKRYGPDAEKVMYGRATNIAKKVAETQMEKSNLKELVRAALMQEKKFPDLTGDGKVTYADILKGRGVDIKEGPEDRDWATYVKSLVNDIRINGVDGYTDYSEDDFIADYEEYIGGKMDLDEDLDLGHEDDEPHMLKGDLYRIGKYAMELYQMVDQFEGMGEVDFPHWWQAKIIKAKEMVSSAKHYLDFETKEPEIDAMVGAIDMSGALDNVGVDEPVTEQADHVSPMVVKAYKEYLQAKKDGDGEKAYRYYSKKLNNTYSTRADRDAIEAILKKKYGSALEEGLPKDYWAKKIPGGTDESVSEGIGTIALGIAGGLLLLKALGFAAKKVVGAIGRNVTLPKEKLLELVETMVKGVLMQSSGKKVNILEIVALRSYLKDEINAGNITTINQIIKVIEKLTKNTNESVDESYEALVKKIKGQGKSEKAAKAIAGAVASYKAKGGGKGPTAKQKARG